MTLLHSLIPRQQSNYTFEYSLRFSSCTSVSFGQCIQHRSDIMAVRTQEKPHKAEDEGDVSHCVHNLIEAFTNGLNIFKRLRERRRKHKARKEIQAPEPINSAELQLSNSLRRGPQDLAERYEECYGQKNMGSRFAEGDCKCSCLCRILPLMLIEGSHCSCVACRNPDEAQHRPR
jgi:hypothetical protein